MVPLRHRHQPDRVERSVNNKQIVLGQAEVFQQQRADFQRASVLDLQPHRLALAAVAQFDFDRLEQGRPSPPRRCKAPLFRVTRKCQRPRMSAPGNKLPW